MFTLDEKSYSKAKTKIISSYGYNKYLKTKVFNAKLSSILLRTPTYANCSLWQIKLKQIEVTFLV